MGRGVSSGGGQSSLGYLFGSDAAPQNARPPSAAPLQQQPNTQPQAASCPAASRQTPPVPSPDPRELPPAGKAGEGGTSLDLGSARLDRNSNNYQRADGQNTGNFLTDRPSTKVHSAPGGGSSLGYLFGGT